MHTRLSLLVCALWVVGAAASSPAVARPSLRAAPFDRPQYLCVNKGFPGGWLIDDPSTFTQSSIDAILAAFGGERGGAARRLCVSFNAWTLIMTPANETTMLRSVDALLSLVETNDLPLSLSLDPTQVRTRLGGERCRDRPAHSISPPPFTGVFSLHRLCAHAVVAVCAGPVQLVGPGGSRVRSAKCS